MTDFYSNYQYISQIRLIIWQGTMVSSKVHTFQHHLTWVEEISYIQYTFFCVSFIVSKLKNSQGHNSENKTY